MHTHDPETKSFRKTSSPGTVIQRLDMDGCQSIVTQVMFSAKCDLKYENKGMNLVHNSKEMTVNRLRIL